MVCNPVDQKRFFAQNNGWKGISSLISEYGVSSYICIRHPEALAEGSH